MTIFFCFRTEADQQKVKLEKMKEEGRDEHEVKKMGEVLQVSGCP